MGEPFDALVVSVEDAVFGKQDRTAFQTRLNAKDISLDTLESNMNAVEVGVRALEEGLLDYMTQVVE